MLVSMETIENLPVQTKHLAEEIISHIREVAGADALVSAFTSAKKTVTAVRSERKRRAAVQVWLCLDRQQLCSVVSQST